MPRLNSLLVTHRLDIKGGIQRQALSELLAQSHPTSTNSYMMTYLTRRYVLWRPNSDIAFNGHSLVKATEQKSCGMIPMALMFIFLLGLSSLVITMKLSTRLWLLGSSLSCKWKFKNLSTGRFESHRLTSQ